jgi:hypothetical protein
MTIVHGEKVTKQNKLTILSKKHKETKHVQNTQKTPQQCQ